MNRREVIALTILASGGLAAGARAADGPTETGKAAPGASERSPPLPTTSGNKIPVAFALSPGAEVVDFSGPWGVFEYVYLPDADMKPFELFTVAETLAPVTVSGGMAIVANHTFETAPQPKLIVVPAIEGDPSEAMVKWLVEASKGTDLTMSVCNGAFVLAKAGLLAGKRATCHHGSYALFQADFPDIAVKRGARYVDEGRIATSGGLSSGIDLALHVVERYFGTEIVENTATALEYQGQGWKDPDSNQQFAKRPVSTDEHPLCPVCEMEVDKATAIKEVYRGKNVYLCSEVDRKRFNRTPERFVDL